MPLIASNQSLNEALTHCTSDLPQVIFRRTRIGTINDHPAVPLCSEILVGVCRCRGTQPNSGSCQDYGWYSHKSSSGLHMAYCITTTLRKSHCLTPLCGPVAAAFQSKPIHQVTYPNSKADFYRTLVQ